jgi:intermediate cleaving peptidase 55
VTPGITALEYAQRRSRLANKLPKNAIAVLAASEVTYRANGIFNNYRQDSNFFYLTGLFSLQAKNKTSSSLGGFINRLQ